MQYKNLDIEKNYHDINNISIQWVCVGDSMQLSHQLNKML